MHGQRFRDMEPGLPEKYQIPESLDALRDAHGSLIREGFEALSVGYVERQVRAARDAGVPVRAVTAEGRNYVGILELAESEGADLIVLGAHGLGATGDGLLGGTAAKVLRNARCDVIVARRDLDSGAMLVGIDGSADALCALDKAAGLARCMDRPLRLAAVYDPDFHAKVFGEMARSLTPDRREEIGLDRQEGLHDTLINDGLGKLYQGFLDEARERATAAGLDAEAALLCGKVYRALVEHAAGVATDLIAVGRFGHHRESISRIGTNVEAVVRTCGTNVLVTAPDGQAVGGSPVSRGREHKSVDEGQLAWDDAATARLQRVPDFVREMARRAVEQAVREAGGEKVTEADFEQVAKRFGMGGGAR
jgi:nucleotide-binding universal stress UspA family protein